MTFQEIHGDPRAEGVFNEIINISVKPAIWSRLFGAALPQTQRERRFHTRHYLFSNNTESLHAAWQIWILKSGMIGTW